MAKETEILEYLIRVETELAKAKDAANALGNVDKETKKVEKSLDRTEKQSKKTENAMNGLKRAVIGLVGYHALKGVTTEAVSTALAFESMDRKMQAATGSAEAGRRSMEFVRREAQRLGKDVLSLGDSYASLTAAAKGTALEGANTQKIFTAVAEATTVLGLSSADTEGVLRAIQQMMSKGTVAAEELRGQLGERLPGAFQIAARSMGVTTRELGKMLEDGEIIADDFLPKFAAELTKTFGPQVENAMNSHAAQLQRIANLWTEAKNSLGGYLLQGMEPLLIKINEATRAIDEARALRGNLSEEQAMALAKENDALAENVKLRLQLMQFAGDPSAGRKLAELEGLQERQYQKVTRGINRFGNKNPFGGHLKKETVTVADAEYAQRFRSFLDNNAEAGIYTGPASTSTSSSGAMAADLEAVRKLQNQLTSETLEGFDKQRHAAGVAFTERAMQIEDLKVDEDLKNSLREQNDAALLARINEIGAAEERWIESNGRKSDESLRLRLERQAEIDNLIQSGISATSSMAANALIDMAGDFDNAGEHAKKFFAGLFRMMAQYILQLLIAKALRSAFGFADGGVSGSPDGLAQGGVRYAAAGMTSAARPTYNARHNVIYGEAGREMLAVLARPRTMSIGGASAVVGRVGGSRVAMMNANDLPTMAANGAINGDGVPRAGAAGGGGIGGNGVLVIRLEEGLKAEMAEAGGMRGLQIVTEHMGTHSKLRSATHKVAKAG